MNTPPRAANETLPFEASRVIGASLLGLLGAGLASINVSLLGNTVPIPPEIVTTVPITIGKVAGAACAAAAGFVLSGGRGE